MLLRMKTLALSFATFIFVGCASGAAEFGRSVQQAGGSAPTAGPATVPGYVASGGTGYLPQTCPAAKSPPAIAQPECR